MIEDLVARVRAYILQHTLIAAGDLVVVAVSGGADSLCLLHVLHARAPELRCRLHVAHLDHGLRGASPADAAFVAAQADALGLPCTVARREVGASARREHQSVEAAARAARYDFLRAVAASSGASAIATGHTRDDQAETLLLHLVRGSGLNGLAGMRPVRAGIIRPLLEVSRAETDAYCAASGLHPRDDESNRSMTYRRNHLRLRIMPLLDELQPNAAANIARAARLLGADLALIERLATQSLEDAIEIGRECASIDSARWLATAPELRPHMLRLLVERLAASADGFEERHYAAMGAALERDAAATCLSLPRGLVLERRGSYVALSRGRRYAAPVLEHATLSVPGSVTTPTGRVRAELATAPPDWHAVLPSEAYLDRAVVGHSLHVRARRPGDRMRPLGMAGSRKVQDIFVDRKVPRDLRAAIPVVEGAAGIAWIAGLCVSDDYRVAPGAPAVHLTWDAYEAISDQLSADR